MPAPIESANQRWKALHGISARATYDRAYDRMRKAAGSDTALLEKLRHLRRWYHLRRVLLAREPLCRECAAVGVVRPAVQADHVRRAIDVIRERGSEAFFDIDNVQPLCGSCHGVKNARERAEA
jgi:5-methylcytosine-specific restriction endonuclease McrA